MLMKKHITLFCIIFLTAYLSIISAQNTSKFIVNGIVKDSDGPLVGVTVLIQGSNIGTTTNVDGKFSISISESQSVLIFSFLGYRTQKINVVKNQSLIIFMETESREIKELVITAQALGQKNAIRQQISSNTIKNVVAADRLQENPDANATEAIGRLPGISVMRSGGEGTGLVIRGLEPRYTTVTLNGIQLPSTSGSDRGTNLSGISQYALQGAEVYKSLTADMDANSVAGTVNLKLRQAPKNLHINVMAQKGYNYLNDDLKNYKFLGEFSNRIFNDRLGILFTANAERVNRSIQTMSAGYGIDSNNPNDSILLNSVSLNDIKSVIYRRSALLSLDYNVSKNTVFMLYGMYSNSRNDYQRQSKNYGIGGAGTVGYSFAANPNNPTDMFQTSISGETKFNFLNIKAEYGFSYSKGKNYNLSGRSWNFNFDKASTSTITDIAHRQLDPKDLIPLFSDNADSLSNCWLTSIGQRDSKIEDENINAYLNFTVPFKIGDLISGNIKFGGMYRIKNRWRDDTVGAQGTNANANQFAPKILADSLPWIERNAGGNISAKGLTDGTIDDFLNGNFNFGNSFNINRLNQISDAWQNISNYYYTQGPNVYLPLFGEVSKLGYTQSVAECMMNDQDIKEQYGAGYLMSEINFGKYVMFLPGIRFEKTYTTMKGFYALPLQYSPSITAPLPGTDSLANRTDQFLLPMIHLRIKPTKTFYMHFAFTQTLSRPDFNAISPNYFVNTGFAPFSYSASNPELRPELWTNLDAQFVFHGKKMGLFSVNAFYKTVKDKIWNRSYQRIKGDAIINPFPNTATVNVSIWENHANLAYVNGVEVDWQSNFSYLPKPFCYFTLSANYTFTNSKTSYPYSRIDLITPAAGGRPVATRIDSTTTGPMILQPKNIANASLGFNKDGFNAWLSFQYNGQIFTGKNYRGVPRLDAQKDYFYRWDLQLTKKFAISKLEGFEVILNIANISNYTESQRLMGDVRPTYQENYGWTSDLGLRFRF
jgi:TonB-dependent receptor